MIPLYYYLILAAVLFAVGLAGALTRRNAILVLVGIELMLNAANLNFIAFLALQSRPGQPHRRHGCDFFPSPSRLPRPPWDSRSSSRSTGTTKTVNVDKMDSLKG